MFFGWRRTHKTERSKQYSLVPSPTGTITRKVLEVSSSVALVTFTRLMRQRNIHVTLLPADPWIGRPLCHSRTTTYAPYCPIGAMQRIKCDKNATEYFFDHVTVTLLKHAFRNMTQWRRTHIHSQRTCARSAHKTHHAHTIPCSTVQ